MQKQIKTFGKTKKRKSNPFFEYIQNIGRSLLYPISILPLAAIFLRVSAILPVGTDPAATEFSILISGILSSVGNAVFGPLLPIIFAVGLSFGLTKDHRGEAALVGVVTMTLFQILLGSKGGSAGAAGSIGIGLVDQIYADVSFWQWNADGWSPVKGFEELFGDGLYTNIMVNNVLTGIIVAILVSTLYNKFNSVELPSILGFFSGRRLIPVLALTSGLFFAILWAVIFPWIAFGIYAFSIQLASAASDRYANAGIMFAYGIINRLLLPFGLHHIPNTLFWFTLGNFPSTGGAIVSGDINIFLSGVIFDPISGQYNNAGTFQTGFFPIMMFGLPALAYAFYKNAQDEDQAKKVASLLFGSAIVSFFTGITEPIEFSFLFIAPAIFGMHALLTGFWGFIVGLFGIQLGFGFSAGFIDYALSLPKSLEIVNAKYEGFIIDGQYYEGVYNQTEYIFANPLWTLLIGPLAGVSYYFGANLLIRKFKQAAPGIAPNLINLDDDKQANQNIPTGFNKFTKDATLFINSVGKENIKEVNWCATRLRLTLKDNEKIDENLLKKSISRGQIKLGSNGYQIIVGTNVEMYGNEVNRLLANQDEFDKATQNYMNDNLVDNHIEIKKQETITNTKILTHNIYSIGNGKISSLNTVNDDAFKNKLLGDGVVVDCKDGKIYAPVDGKVSSIFPTNHAFSITTADGINILVHIGIDTNKLGANNFKPNIKVDQEVKKGQFIYLYNYAGIVKNKLDPRTIVVVTNDSSRKVKKTNSELIGNMSTVIIELEN